MPTRATHGPASAHDDRATMVEPRRLHLDTPRLDDVVHRVLQLALLGLVRDDAPTLAGVEDLRLALDEVLLDRAIVAAPRIELDVASSCEEVVVEVTVHAPDIRVELAYLTALVDEATVRVRDDATVVTLRRQWPTTD